MNFKNYLNENNVTEIAKLKKLKYAGWNKWKNTQGEITHKTVDGKLIKIERTP